MDDLKNGEWLGPITPEMFEDVVRPDPEIVALAEELIAGMED